MNTLGASRRDFQACASTNDEALKWAKAGAPHGALVVAEAQSHGRGRGARTWNSPPGCGLYFSLVVRMPIPFSRVPLLTMAAALGAARALDGLARGAAVKWPNDILLNKKKIGGILSEGVPLSDGSLDYAVIGMGLNVAHQSDDLPPRPLFPATSLLLETARRYDNDDVLSSVLREMQPLLSLVHDDPDSLRHLWQPRDEAQGRTVEIRGDGAGTVWRGIVDGVDTGGALQIFNASGEKRRVVAGDVFIME